MSAIYKTVSRAKRKNGYSGGGGIQINEGTSGRESVCRGRNKHEVLLPYSDTPAVWEAGDLDWPVTWKVLSLEHKQSPLCESRDLKAEAQIENRAGNLLECGSYKKCFEKLDISLAIPPVTRIFAFLLKIIRNLMMGGV